MDSRVPFRRTLIKLVVFAVVSGLVTTIVFASLLDLNLRPTKGYHVVFPNAAGLQSGDTVRIAGVQVGKVTGVSLRGNDAAVVSFNVDNSQTLTDTTQATIHYASLLGQRFLALLPGLSPGTPLHSGAEIPENRTTPALDLTTVFNGFRPLFSALQPDQVNELSASVIQIFQGESTNISSLVEQTASLTQNLANRQAVIDSLLHNLAGLLTSVGSENTQLGQLIDSFDTMVNGLAGERTQIGSSITSLSALTTQVSQLLGSAQPDLDTVIARLATAGKTVTDNQSALDGMLKAFPAFLDTFNKATSTGNYMNIYVCNLAIGVLPPLKVSLVPGIPPGPGDVLTLPHGDIGNRNSHTAVCR